MKQNQPAMFLSVVIPAYNEQARLAQTLDAVHDYLKRQSYTLELAVVDDGSTDETAEIVNRWIRFWGVPGIKTRRPASKYSATAAEMSQVSVFSGSVSDNRRHFSIRTGSMSLTSGSHSGSNSTGGPSKARLISASLRR
jgi:cellulose synthase/poly-beta-1,6-N-acetylglucosamine synthase-like glycosyltransferase